MSCNYKAERIIEDKDADYINQIKEDAEAKYWILYARENGAAAWYAQKQKLLVIRGEKNVRNLVRNMERLRNNL